MPPSHLRGGVQKMQARLDHVLNTAKAEKRGGGGGKTHIVKCGLHAKGSINLGLE